MEIGPPTFYLSCYTYVQKVSQFKSSRMQRLRTKFKNPFWLALSLLVCGLLSLLQAMQHQSPLLSPSPLNIFSNVTRIWCSNCLLIINNKLEKEFIFFLSLHCQKANELQQFVIQLIVDSSYIELRQKHFFLFRILPNPLSCICQPSHGSWLSCSAFSIDNQDALKSNLASLHNNPCGI